VDGSCGRRDARDEARLTVSLLRRVVNRFRRTSLDREFDDEIAFHLEERIRRNLDQRMNPRDAAAAAQARFGSIERAKAGMREARIASRTIPLLAVAVVGALLGGGIAWHASVRVYDLDGSVTAPVPLVTPRPEYTMAARRAKIQGTVRVGCVVRPEGACSHVRVVRSLDRTLGLDAEAVHAISEWRFRPALREGKPVPTRVMFDFTFALR
jgi:TonB family protein